MRGLDGRVACAGLALCGVLAGCSSGNSDGAGSSGSASSGSTSAGSSGSASSGSASSGSTGGSGASASGNSSPSSGSPASTGSSSSGSAATSGSASGTTQQPDAQAPGDDGGDAGSSSEAGSTTSGDGGPSIENPGPPTDPAAKMKCTGTSPIHCVFGGAPGNYDVTAVLGGATAGQTQVQTEMRRALLPVTNTAAGTTARFSWSINVRDPEGEPVVQGVDPTSNPNGLELFFMGPAPQLAEIGFAPSASPIVVYIASDSTGCDQATPTYGGWGQELPRFFKAGVVVANYAESGLDTSHCLADAPYFPAIMKVIKPNDWVFIQLAHNDKTIALAPFQANLLSMVNQTKAKGAFPVLLTPIVRATYAGALLTEPQHTHTLQNGTVVNLPKAIRDLAAAQKVPLIDLTSATTDFYNSPAVGPNGWQKYHATFPPGSGANTGKPDSTHTNELGADVNAGFVRDGIRSNNLMPLVNFLR